MSDLLPWMAPWSGRVLTLAVVLFGLALFVYALRRPRYRDNMPRCGKCGYNITGVTSPTCPECGHILRPNETHRRPRRWRLAVVGLLIAMAMPSYVVQRRVRDFGWDYYLKLYPLYALFPDEKLSDVTVYGVRIRRFCDRRFPWERRVMIKLGQQTILDEKAEHIWSIGFEQSPDPGAPPEVWFVDVNDDGVDEVCVRAIWPGVRDSAYYVLRFDRRGETTKFIGLSQIEGEIFFNRDKQGCYIEYFSDHYRHGWISGAGSPDPMTYLRFENGEFTLDVERMRARARPTQAEIEAATAEIGDERQPDLFAPACAIALEMIYRGDAPGARELLRKVERRYLDLYEPPTASLVDEVFEAVRTAPFGPEILALSE